MKLGIVTDAACDLAANFIEDYKIDVLPVKITKGNMVIFDSKDPLISAEIREGLKDNGKLYKTEALSPEELKDHLIKILRNPEKESFLFLLSSSTRGEMYNNVVTAISKIIPEVRSIRQESGAKPNITFEVMDSMQVSTGLGVLISEIVITAKKEINFEDLIKRVKQSVHYTQVFLIPDKLSQLYSKPSNSGDANIGLGSYLMSKTLDVKPIIQSYKGVTKVVAKAKGFDKALDVIFKLIILDIKSGAIRFKNISISYGGESNKRKELIESNLYLKLKDVADKHNVSITVAKMGATMMVNLGPDAISIGYISSNIANVEI